VDNCGDERPRLPDSASIARHQPSSLSDFHTPIWFSRRIELWSGAGDAPRWANTEAMVSVFTDDSINQGFVHCHGVKVALRAEIVRD